MSGETQVTVRKPQSEPEAEIEYIKVLIEKATPEHDSPMVVDWIPKVLWLIERVELLEREYADLAEDYIAVKARLAKARLKL